MKLIKTIYCGVCMKIPSLSEIGGGAFLSTDLSEDDDDFLSLPDFAPFPFV